MSNRPTPIAPPPSRSAPKGTGAASPSPVVAPVLALVPPVDEEQLRRQRGTRIAARLTLMDYSVEQVEDFSDFLWQAVATLSKVSEVPDARTRALVLSILRGEA